MKKMKDSGIEWIGQIPEDRKLIRSKYALSYIKGRIPTETNTEQNGVPYIGASDLDNLSGRSEYSIYTRDTDIPVCGYEDILVLWDGARAGLIGRNHMGAISSTIVKIIPNDDIDKRFFFWYLKGFEKYLYECVNGTTIPHMNKKYIEDISMLDWSLDDQIRIADFLDEKCSKIDRYIEKQQQIIDKLKAYKQAVITEAVTKGLDPDVPMKDSGIEWIGEIPEHWKIEKLKYATTIMRGKFSHRPRNDPDYYDGQYPFVQTGDVARAIKYISTYTQTLNELGYSVSKEFPKGSIVMTIAANVADVAILDFNACFPDSVVGFVPEEIKQMYLFYALRSMKQQLLRNAIISTQLNLNIEIIKEEFIPIPSEYEQEMISHFIDGKCDEIDSTISKKQALIDKITEYKKSLIYEAVTGKLEV